ncbi:HDOD domain-containing protein [Desulfonatronum sp. SC1]|uniref:HDOD domain-containing protein n=1 Tax=Desulfonatronum sp. SC1 TaxID=2109626 RepID=UPI000D30AD2A|nr:HDOD domain-containing protein [Desulfonatronum sp. SC1]PTN38910.1 metal-dependent hydrolase [Desulfonatronum sp. SC1]
MGLVKVDDFKPGMVLAADLKSSQGRMLLPEGIQLTEQHIKTCKIWGVVEGDILGEGNQDAEAPPPVLNPEDLEKARCTAQVKFCLTDVRHPMVREAVKLYILRKAQALALNADDASEVLNLSDSGPSEQVLSGREKVEDIVQQELELASHPDILRHILQASSDPLASAAYVAEVVGKDVALSAKLLKVVNTPYYGFPQKVDTISRAIVLLGQEKVAGLALGISVINMFQGAQGEMLDMVGFWKHSVACGIVGMVLAAHCNEQDKEHFFVAGLLHDVGRLIMLKNRVQAVQSIFSESRGLKVALHDLEKARWGFDHASLAELVLEKWQLPDNLLLAVRYHHSPGACGYARDAVMVHVADFLAHSLALGDSGATLVPPLDNHAWESLGLSKNVLPVLARQVDAQVGHIMRIFFG